VKAVHLSNLFEVPCHTSAGFIDEADPEQLEALHPLLEGELPERYEQWAEKRRREFRAGRHHAKEALTLAGAKSQTVPRAEDGLPRFPGTYRGTISHTGKKRTFAASTVTTSNAHIGLDVEERRVLEPDLYSHILQEEELRALTQKHDDTLPGTDGERVLIAFSAKEAFYKCVYPRVRAFLAFTDVHVEFLGSQRFRIRPLRGDLPNLPSDLDGRFCTREDLVACGVTWKD